MSPAIPGATPETYRSKTCLLCSRPGEARAWQDAVWAAPEVMRQLANQLLEPADCDGACASCVQQALLEVMVRGTDEQVRESIHAAWPLDRESAFGALPTPLRMHADPQYSGQGVTLAMVDSGFYPHPDLCRPRNRIRAWVNASFDPLAALRFAPQEQPRWPGWDERRPHFWHGMMTSCAAAGNGWLSRGLYRGLAFQADVVLVQTADERGRITDGSITRALEWILEHADELGIRVVNLSVCGDEPVPNGPIDDTIKALVEAGVTVVAAAGNNGERGLVPPATAPHALTVGGIDDHNTIPREDCELWHSNFGQSCLGLQKPEVVAPSVWVVAPLLPDTDQAREALELFARRRAGDRSADAEIAENKLVRPEYKLTEGTSFAAPLVSSVICCMLEANPALTPKQIHQLVISSAIPVSGASPERQGAGALDAGLAVAAAARAADCMHDFANSPCVTPARVRFTLRHAGAREIAVRGDWDEWAAPGIEAKQIQEGVWVADIQRLAPGRYLYRFLVDGTEWRDDPSNKSREPDAEGLSNSVLIIPGREKAA